MKNFFNKNKKGFTLIEMMIATALFTILTLIIIGAVLSVNSARKKTSGVATIMNNMNFILDDMVFNMRTGANYGCGLGLNPGSYPLPSFVSTPNFTVSANTDCPNGNWGIIMGSAYGPDPVAYAIGVDLGKPLQARIYKSDNGGQNFYAMSPVEVEIDANMSKFIVSGSGSGDDKQPMVFIRIVGKIKYKDIESPFSVQTTVSQRQIDS